MAQAFAAPVPDRTLATPLQFSVKSPQAKRRDLPKFFAREDTLRKKARSDRDFGASVMLRNFEIANCSAPDLRFSDLRPQWVDHHL
jgi:hypothetical protein